jgi:hypothetical protein
MITDVYKKRVRRDYAPLITSVQLVCTTPASPLGQIYNSENGQYEPDRTLTPTVIRPDVQAWAKDGSWKQKQVNSILASVKWYVNGNDISTLSGWSGLYSIETEGDNKGAITISKNVKEGDVFGLSFSAVFADSRFGRNVTIKSEEVVLTTSRKGDDNYSVSLDDAKEIQYDPTKDNLLIYDYEVAHGIITASDAKRKAALDSNAYERTIPFTVRRSKTAVTSGFTVKLYEISGTTLTEVSAAAATAVKAITTSGITLDMRLIKKKNYKIRIYVDGTMVAEHQFSVTRIYQSVTCVPTNGAAIMENDVEQYNVAQAKAGGNIIKYPGLMLDITWKTDTYAKTGVEHNMGGEAVINLNRAGLGSGEDDSWMDVYTEYSLKEPYKPAQDASGNGWVDSNGNAYIWV